MQKISNPSSHISYLCLQIDITEERRLREVSIWYTTPLAGRSQSLGGPQSRPCAAQEQQAAGVTAAPVGLINISSANVASRFNVDYLRTLHRRLIGVVVAAAT